MKTFIALAFLSTSALAVDLKVRCVGTHNYAVEMDANYTLSDGQRDLAIGTTGEYELFLSSKGGRAVELQAYTPYEPSRTYGTSVLREKNDSVILTLWKRESIIEVQCILL